MSALYELYKKVGNEQFGIEVGKIAPYFSTISPQFVQLAPAYCEIILQKQHSVENHIGTIHAIAICNGAELVAGLMTDVSIPNTYRWIPTSMHVDYLAKAESDLHIIAKGDDIDWSTLGKVDVHVDALNSDNNKVFTATITMYLSKK